MSLVDLSLQPPVNISKLKLKALKEKNRQGKHQGVEFFSLQGKEMRARSDQERNWPCVRKTMCFSKHKCLSNQSEFRYRVRN